MQKFYNTLKPILPIVMLGLLSACQNAAAPETGSQTSSNTMPNHNALLETTLAGSGRWTPEPSFGSPDKPPHIVFEQDQKGKTKIIGMAGCNRIFGAYSQDKSAISFGAIVSTKMACPHLDEEMEFLDKLKSAKSYLVHGQYLIFFGSADQTGQPILYLRPTDN